VLSKPDAWGDASWTFDLPSPYAGVSSSVERSDDPFFLDEAGAVGHLGVYAAVGLPGGVLPKPLPAAYQLPATSAGGVINRPDVPVIIWVMAEETDGGEFVPGSDSATKDTLRDALIGRLEWKFGSRTAEIAAEILSQPWYSLRSKAEAPDVNSVVTPQRAYMRIVTDLRMRCGAAALADALAEGAQASSHHASTGQPAALADALAEGAQASSHHASTGQPAALADALAEGAQASSHHASTGQPAALADALAEGAQASSHHASTGQPVYSVVVDQGPGPGDEHPILGDWSRGLMYTPRWSFHGWDVMLLYGWRLPWPVHQYSEADLELQHVIRSALTEFGSTGAVRGWEPCDPRDEGRCASGTLRGTGWSAATGAAEACGVLASHFGVWNYTLSG